MSLRSPRWGLVHLTIALGLLGPPAAAVAADASTSAPVLRLDGVVSGLDSPLDIAVRPAFPDDIVVAEQVGRLRIVRDGTLVEEPLLDIEDAVTAGGEQGLLGVAPHPDPADDRVFVYHTDRDERQVVSSFRAEPDDPHLLARDSEVVVLVMDDQFGNHNGGGLAFGPDGYLYVATGDGGGGGDPLGSGRDLGSLLGKILRLDVDVGEGAESAYAIPPDNPFVDVAGARPEIWHTGLRNPFRFRIDEESGDMWIGDVGQNEWEEVDLAPGGIGGLDFGWNLVEGTHCFAADPCDDPGLMPPVVEYSHDLGCTVIGGDVWRPADEPASAGWYLFNDNCSGTVFAVAVAEARSAAQDGSQVEPVVVLESGRPISAIARGPGGDLYVTDLDGELLRLVDGSDA
jgi:hypothetical protein